MNKSKKNSISNEIISEIELQISNGFDKKKYELLVSNLINQRIGELSK